MISPEARNDLHALTSRMNALLPEEYHDQDVPPVSMGSAGLRHGSDGKVAWNEMWATFCYLAMAGGPPHRGTLLLPGSLAAIAADPDRYGQVVEEICRGIVMVTGLSVQASPNPGWVRVTCATPGMAAWLLRAVVMENVSARCDGRMLDLPAGPAYRIEKEIKNVITSIAKTCHYWVGHVSPTQKRIIIDLLALMDMRAPLLQPDLSEEEPGNGRRPILSESIATAIFLPTGLRSSDQRYRGWLGLECNDAAIAIWIMRAFVASNVLSRREGSVVFIPVNPFTDPHGERCVEATIRVHALAAVRG